MHDYQRDVVFGHAAADEVSHDLVRDAVGRAGRDRLS